MAIEVDYQISEIRTLEKCYVKINTPRSYKKVEGENSSLKLVYDAEIYLEKGGLLLAVIHGQEASNSYNGGDIYTLSYADLKTNELFTNIKNV